MRCELLAAAALSCAVPAAATAAELRIEDVRIVRGAGAASVHFTIGWKHAWRNDRNHDAAWVFVKLRPAGGAWRHARVTATPIVLGGGPRPEVGLPEDHAGFFIFAGAPHRGAVRWLVTAPLEPSALERLPADAALEAQVFGLEMTYVPEGAFTLGDPDPAALEFSAFYKSGADGRPDGLFQVRSEAAFEVAPAAGALYYRSKMPQYEGDQKGPVPAAFPKGFRAFYMMKYELTQGQYAAFLNTLGDEPSFFRAIHGGRDYYSHRGTIRLQDGLYVADKPDRPANRVSWEDGIAFADWAGLRPMSELEFTKAARGTATPVPHEYPWGRGTKERLRRVMQPDDDLANTGEADEALLTDDTREVLGASFYWVMDLAGSVWERAVTIGHPIGRSFRGTHGDGLLSGYGSATNADWPRGDEAPGGYGYRGGGYYEQGMKEREFNPYSPIAYRRFGSWGQAPRSLAYGFRAVRTAEPPASGDAGR